MNGTPIHIVTQNKPKRNWNEPNHPGVKEKEWWSEGGKFARDRSSTKVEYY